MARLVHRLVFPLGGEGLTGGKPWIVNFVPKPDSENVSLLRPVRMSFRDAETYIDPEQMLIEVGYAKVHADSDAVDSFEKLPRTRRLSLQQGFIETPPNINRTVDGIIIQKTVDGPQRSVYGTLIDGGSGFQSAMVSAVVRPLDIASQGGSVDSGPLNQSIFPGPLLPLPYSTLEASFASGTVLGLEHGPRGKVIYLFFNVLSSSRYLQLASFQPLVGEPDIKLIAAYDWSEGFSRYTIVWNEAVGDVEVYADLDGRTQRIFRLPITSIPDMPEDYYCRVGGPRDVAAIYGQEGSSGDRSAWKNIAVTTDVGYPILGNIRPGTFQTRILGSELLKTVGDRDPRDLDVGCWLQAEAGLFPSPDPDLSAAVAGGLFTMTKPTAFRSFVIYREEPGLLRSNNNGFMIQANLAARPTRQDSAATGMGFVVYDGRSVFQVMLFNDFATKTVGLQRRFAPDVDMTQHFVPNVAPIDWSKTGFRLVVDPRSDLIKFYSLDDLSTPLMAVNLDRDLLPTGADRGWDGKTPFIAFGHISAETNSHGALDVSEITACHLYQEWEAKSGTPEAASPPFTASMTGGASRSLNSGIYTLDTPQGSVVKLSRAADFSRNRGGAFEARLRITRYRPRTRTGVYAFLDDGNTTYALTFVESSVGKFVALSRRAALGGFSEVVGRDGLGRQLSFACDWTQYHTYRLERLPYEGVRVFLDNEALPRLEYPENLVAQFPDEQFSGNPSLAFGHFTGESTTSQWQYLRGFFSGGYEISFKKNKPDKILRQELFGTQAIVVAYAEDRD